MADKYIFRDIAEITIFCLFIIQETITQLTIAVKDHQALNRYSLNKLLEIVSFLKPPDATWSPLSPLFFPRIRKPIISGAFLFLISDSVLLRKGIPVPMPYFNMKFFRKSQVFELRVIKQKSAIILPRHPVMSRLKIWTLFLRTKIKNKLKTTPAL